ncbi:hypothetical protein BCV69DRAFT_100728 [Microstroma glucosiphilum]|uniref:non-specific serine/threonine protein kinase n=1 Tax=Pseudomicrostroma glucosiphilum TaxID=1684307 RepID=A0A316UDI2_9BASI|nr:hypothetical protein BCV69DRAFT_100728 [Pseudomicrostroma glucosiphilum]PWN22904.1 hypothetical protein BCV69DRAFT_100728 [Pseudomicrostroma glucosiphilum]
MASIASSSKASWPARHETIVECLGDDQVQSLIVTVAKEPTVASACARARQLIKGKQRARDDEQDVVSAAEHSLALDLALASWWSQTPETRKRFCSQAAQDRLKDLTTAVPAPNDFPSVTSLQRSSAAYVEIVRSRFNRQLYVIKTVVKGLARRESNRCSPAFEAHLLSLGSQTPSGVRPVPDLVAAFQSQNSLHIVMEYFPAGDLDQLLHSAGEAGGAGLGLARNGGLLDESFVKAYATDIVGAVGWCHEQGFAHRDVKPANFLLDRTGHLKLCDFATAAPFSTFAGQRRRVHHFYACLAGTPDYIAPDILLGEEERLNALAKEDQWLGTTYADSSTSFASCSRSRAPAPAPDSEGSYGPEVDWWSVGVVVYEMVYKVVPFWADSIREAHYRIRNHESFLELDGKVPTSSALEALIRGLLCRRDTRLGASLDGTRAIKDHPFFADVEWASYMSAPAPFVPNLPASSHAQSIDGLPLSPSVLHSPRPLMSFAPDDDVSMTPESIALSQIYEGDLENFPAFVDSRDGILPEQERDFAEQAQKSMTIQNVYTGAATEADWALHSRAASDPTSPVSFSKQAAEASRRDIDVNWIGFTKLPAAEAFGPGPKPRPTPTSLSLPMATPVISRMRSFSTILEASPACSSAAASPDIWARRGSEDDAPMTSTPYHAGEGQRVYSSPAVHFASQPTPPPAISAATPYTFTRKKSLQRRALEMSSRMATPGDGRFVTPSRKTSMPNIASAFASQQSSMVPASPYPFPVAARATPGTLDRRRGAAFAMAAIPSYRAVSQSPHSSSAAGSMGSESRCSGGSNAKRDVSENEAMEQLVQAVAQSARKVRIASEDKVVLDRLSALENRLFRKAGGGPQVAVHRPVRPPLRQSHTDTDSQISEGKARLLKQTSAVPGKSGQTLQRRETIASRRDGVVAEIPSGETTPLATAANELAKCTMPGEDIRKVSATGQASAKPSPPLVSVPDIVHHTSSSSPKEARVEATSGPHAVVSSHGVSAGQAKHPAAPIWTERRFSSSSSSSSSSSTASGAPADSEQLRPPSLAVGGRSLRNQRSKRQLRLEAQERTTPTRPARALAPQVQIDRFEQLSLGSSSGGEQKHEGDSTPGLTDGGASTESESIGTESLHSDAHNVAAKGGSPTRRATGATRSIHTFWETDAPSSSGDELVAKPTVFSGHTSSRLSLQPLSFEATRLRSKSHGQLPKLRIASGSQPDLPTGGLNLIQESQQRRGSSSSMTGAPRMLRKKDSRETLSEYRKGIVRPATPTGALPSPFLPSSIPGTPGTPVIEEDDAFGGGAVVPSPIPIAVRGLRKPSRRASSATLGESYAHNNGTVAALKAEIGDKPAQRRSTSGPLPIKERRSSTSPLMPASSSSRNSLSLLSITEEDGGARADMHKSLQQPTKQVRRAKSRLSIMTSPTLKEVPTAGVVDTPPISGSMSNTTSLRSASSPLTKMDRRFGGLQNSFDGLQSRITDIKARLQG